MRSLGVDLGGSKLLACVTDEQGTMLGATTRITGRATGPGHAHRLIVAVARELQEAYGPCDAVGIGFPGTVDFHRGIACASVMLDGWRNVPLADWVSRTLGIHCVVDNDVNAAAIAELRRREEELPESMLFIAVGTGIGGAITFGNQLWRGHAGVAGEIGNMSIDRHGERCWCGRRGCLNTLASGTAIAQQLGPGRPPLDLAMIGDPRVEAAVDAAAAALGFGVANALNLLNPALVVLGGGVAQFGARWLDTVSRVARAEAFPEAGQCKFEFARAGYAAGAVGAALLGIGSCQLDHAALPPGRQHDSVRQ